MKKSWFQHENCTTEQSEELVESYLTRGVRVEKSLNSDRLTWAVSAYLPEALTEPRPDSRYQQRIWR